VEYWSFIRKKNAAAKNIFASNLCPACNAELPADMGEVATCRFCSALVNSGAFDWVLAEITQADDYFKYPSHGTADNLRSIVESLRAKYEDFSVQLMEDKASNGYMQIMNALAKGDATLVRRLTSDACFEKIKRRIPAQKTLFSRLYLNSVVLSTIRKDQSRYYVSFALTRSSQTVTVLDENNFAFDPAMAATREVLLLSRSIEALPHKGQLYLHQCPSCGANIRDTIDVKCSYCGSPLNSGANEWIFEDYMTMGEYEKYFSLYRKEFSFCLSPVLLDSLYSTREYAFNNVLIMIAADGVFARQEQAVAEEIARAWKLKTDNLQPLFDMTKSDRLSVRMPHDVALRRKTCRLLKQVAEADESISPEEQKVLDFIKRQYLPND
jgi:ribosomal protein L37AE/L43A